VTINEKIRRFFFPRITPKFLVRVLLVAVFAYLFFGYVCTPLRIKGHSMEPAYRDRGFIFCWRPRYLFSKPERHDVVVVRYAGNEVMLLKRVVGLEGEWVEFREGKLFVDGKEIDESYVRYPCAWNLPPRQVEKGWVYVVGDNRDMPIEIHMFGQAPINRIKGAPLW
jgi:signal peptidase I